MKRIKLGLIGYGLNGFGHHAEIQLIPSLRKRFKVVAIFEPSFSPDAGKGHSGGSVPIVQKRLKAIAHKGTIRVTNSFDSFLDVAPMDAVMICSPPKYHADQAVSALEKGLHVYSEVPMALNYEDIERIVKAEEKSGKVYMLGENYCYFSEVLYAGRLISSRKLGEPVYAEAEYLHDVSYRWRKGGSGGPDTPRVDAWYQEFDPMMYAHTVGPAQVALGGIESPIRFSEVVSYANDLGGYQGPIEECRARGEKPLCYPAKAFQVALFRSDENVLAKCANAYIFAREPNRISIQVTGRLGTYECYQIGKSGRLFIADDHIITKTRHRKGSVKKVGKITLSKEIPLRIGSHHGSGTRIMEAWYEAIVNGKPAPLDSRAGANMCAAGIAAVESARNGGKPTRVKFADL